MQSNPALRGGLLAIIAAILFGTSAPLMQRAGVGMGAFTTAALLYIGAAVIAFLMRASATREARLSRADLPRLIAMAGFGAVIGPVALAWGLQHTSGSSASLMLTLEALFTALIAWQLYGESMDKRVALAMLLILAGGLVLVWAQGIAGTPQLLGLLAVLLATIAWGVDNGLSRALALRDPGQVVFAKASLGASATTALALVAGEPMPTPFAAAAMLAIGATGYGLSLRFYLLAQRAFGAARTGSVFALAPFIGAAVAFALGDRFATGLIALGGALMLAGVWLHLSESHGHAHRHDAAEHEHAHTHDDGHHLHTHADAPIGTHSHPHTHEAAAHTHPHVPDVHHGHTH